MRDGVTVTDPQATYVDADVAVDADATLHPGTILEGATRIGAGAVVGPHSHLTDTVVAEGAAVHSSRCDRAEVGPRASVGPNSFLRPGARLAAEAKVGAFCEVKSSDIGEGAKVPHLSYVGDARVGAGANIGAATVTVNYDGFEKHRTEVGARARVGSDTMLVAPVRVGEDAFTGAGSVITEDVPDGALAVERSEQVVKPGYAERKRAHMREKQAAEESREREEG
jgi:bifunctional UDP-N-acetylglucosamine pyrophosphorylase/glucosamine-1-phosphate N-acetyltransferase